MAEYIDRDKAIEKINAYCELRQAICLNDKDEYLRGLQTALKAISYNDVIPNEDVQPVNQWISVDDSLPPDNKPCVVMTENNGLGVSRLMGRNRIEWTLFGEPVLYWMPISELPEVTKG